MPPRSRNPEASADPTPSPSPEAVPVVETPEPSPLFSHSPDPSPSPSYPSYDPSQTPSPSDELDADFGSPRPSTDHGPASPSGLPGLASTWRKRRRELLGPAKAAVATAGGIAHTLLTAEGTAERHVGLYLPDEEDVEAIAEPLAGLASRRVPEGVENPDVGDVIGLVMGLVGYVVKQLSKRAQVRNTFAGQVEPDAAQGDDAEPADQ